MAAMASSRVWSNNSRKGESPGQMMTASISSPRRILSSPIGSTAKVSAAQNFARSPNLTERIAELLPPAF